MALAEERHFGRAAARLHMSQPPLTRQIRVLEEQLKAKLFLRTSKGVELTDAGQVLYDEVPNLLMLAQRAKERAQRAGHGYTGRLDVGLFGSSALDVIPRLLSRFHRERPEVQIVLHNLSRADQLAALRERRISVGFSRLVASEPDLVVESVLRERLMVALYEGHPLCAKSEITIADMENEPLILYPDVRMHGLAQEVAHAFVREGVRLRVEQQVGDVLTGVALVASGFGLCVIPESGASLRLPGVLYRPLNSGYLRHVELNCVYRRRDFSQTLSAFVQMVRRFASERPVPAAPASGPSPAFGAPGRGR